MLGEANSAGRVILGIILRDYFGTHDAEARLRNFSLYGAFYFAAAHRVHDQKSSSRRSRAPDPVFRFRRCPPSQAKGSNVVNRGIERRAIFRDASVRRDSEGVPRSNQSSALSRSLGVKRPKLRHDFLALALRTFDIFLLVLGDCHCDREILVAVLTEIFVEGHRRRSFPYDQ